MAPRGVRYSAKSQPIDLLRGRFAAYYGGRGVGCQAVGVLAITIGHLILIALSGTGVRESTHDCLNVTHLDAPDHQENFLWQRIQICFCFVFF